jgi:hypothetical protein
MAGQTSRPFPQATESDLLWGALSESWPVDKVGGISPAHLLFPSPVHRHTTDRRTWSTQPSIPQSHAPTHQVHVIELVTDGGLDDILDGDEILVPQVPQQADLAKRAARISQILECVACGPPQSKGGLSHLENQVGLGPN